MPVSTIIRDTANQNAAVTAISLNSPIASIKAGEMSTIVKAAIIKHKTPIVVKVADNPFILSPSLFYNSRELGYSCPVRVRIISPVPE